MDLINQKEVWNAGVQAGFNCNHESAYFFCPYYSILANYCHCTAKSLQSCPTLCDPIPRILQARTLSL